jgi:hypothetical protein
MNHFQQLFTDVMENNSLMAKVLILLDRIRACARIANFSQKYSTGFASSPCNCPILFASNRKLTQNHGKTTKNILNYQNFLSLNFWDEKWHV